MHDQRTDGWHQDRLGKVTASCLSRVMAKTKSGWGADRANYMAQLVCERLTGLPTEMFVNDAMRRGTELESQARAMYELETGYSVAETGFHPHPTIEMTGASPDGFVLSDGLVEIKVPNSATHIATLRGEPIPDKYIKQMQWQIACTGRDWCDFASFDPRLSDPMQLHIQRIERDDAMIAEMEEAVQKFLAEVDKAVADLKARYPDMREAA